MLRIASVRKIAWQPKQQQKVLKGSVLSPSAAMQDRYYRALANLVHRMTAETSRELRKLFDTEHAQEFFAEDISVAAQARILMDRITSKFEKLFADFAEPLAERMVDDADDNSAASLKASLRDLTNGITLNTDILTKDLKVVLQASIAENVSLIKSIPQQYLDGVKGAVYRSIATGNGLADLVPFLNKHEGITLRRARTIALDQTKKSFSAINKHRMQALQLDDFEWLHSGGGQHPRKLHISYSGKLFKLSDPPIIDLRTGERGIPGQAINCRCVMRPVIRFSEV